MLHIPPIALALAFSATLVALPSASAQSRELTIGTLNTESASDTLAFSVAATIRDAGSADLWALQEVEGVDALEEFTVAAASAGRRSSFRYVLSESGAITSMHRKNDFLGFVYNSSRLRQVETVELHGIRSTPGAGRLGDAEWGLRGALFMRFQDRDTRAEFYVGNVHLKCCGDGAATRAHQVSIINQWIERSDVPVILTGDFNIPIEPDAEDGPAGSAAFDALTETMEWLRPENPIKRQCSDRFNSMLDHVFVRTSGANVEPIDVRILETDEAFCVAETDGGPDHRPVVARFLIR